jgi:hypothetical protein
MNRPMTELTLKRENAAYRGSGGVSDGNRERGFRPAFLDRESGTVWLSRFVDGRPAPIHTLESLPDALVKARDPRGRIIGAKASVVSGFVRHGRFYSRDEAAAALRAAA